MNNNTITAGSELSVASKALILLHGRGSNAADILSLQQYLNVKEYALLAPQANRNTWYPYSFMAPVQENEPALTQSLSLIDEAVQLALSNGIAKDAVFFAGFSQGACVMLEYAARNATRYGGLVAFTGGLIGERINLDNYKGNFEGTPVFIGTADPDPHVPVERVYATGNILRDMGAEVTEKVYPYMGHTINEDEISNANALIFS